MIALKISNDNKTIINTFPVNFNISKIEKNKYIKKDCDFGTLEIFISNEKKDKNEDRFIYSNKNFKSLVNIIEGLSPIFIKEIKNNTEEILDEYLHNIIKIHGNQKAIVERFTYFDKPTESHSDFIDAVENRIKEKPEQFARDICELSKEVRFMDYHIGGYNLLNNKKIEKSITRQNLKRFLLELSHQFFKDLSSNNISINLRDVRDDVFCSFEYETFSIAIHNFLQNAVKYAKPNSLIKVFTDTENKQLIFSMDSVKIEKNEMDRIYEKGTFGINTPERLRGNGIGMNTLKKALERSSINIYIAPDFNKSELFNGIHYVRNVFYFTFPTGNYKNN